METKIDWIEGEKAIDMLPERLPLNCTRRLFSVASPEALPEALYVRSSQLPDTFPPTYSSLVRSSNLLGSPLHLMAMLKVLPPPELL